MLTKRNYLENAVNLGRAETLHALAEAVGALDNDYNGLNDGKNLEHHLG